MPSVKFTNFARGLLSVGISAGDSSLTVSSGTGALFPTLSGGDWFYATIENASLSREVVKVTARSGDVFTITRGQDGTTASAWSAGVSVSLRMNAAAIADSIAAWNGVLVTAAMEPVVEAATLAAGRTALGASASGDTVFTGTAAQGRTALGSGATGDAVFVAASATAARTTLGAVGLTGDEAVGGVKTFSSQPVLPQAPVLMATQATTSGTQFDFTAIPSWVKKITLTLNNVSTNGTSTLLIRIGSGSFLTSGYDGVANGAYSGNSWAVAGSTTGFGIQYSNIAANFNYGQVVLTHMGSNLWVLTSIVSATGVQGGGFLGGGSITLGGALDRVRLTTGGGDTFDAGSVNVLYE